MKNIFIVILSLLPFLAAAQKNVPAFDQASPYSSVYWHLYYLQNDSYQPSEAAKVIFEAESAQEASELAIKIKQVLDGKGLKVVLSGLPREKEYQDSLKRKRYLLFPNELPQIYLEKYEDKWYYSKETSEVISDLHQEVYPFGSDVLINLFPRFGNNTFLGIFLWQWFGFGLLLVFAWLLQLLFTKVLSLFIKGITSTRLGQEYLESDMIWKIARLISLIAVFYIIKALLPILQISIDWVKYAYSAIDICIIVFLIFLGLRITDYVFSYLRKMTERTESKMDDQLFPIIDRFVRVAIVLVGVIYVLNALDINVTALIAGVSIGGLAIALAAQDTVKNLIGSMMIFVDKPFQIGDYVITDGVQGTVEEVGFRSTRVRASDTSIFTIPNGKMADLVVNNLGSRVYRRYKVNLGITYDTPPDVIKKFVDAVRTIVIGHPATITDRGEVYLHEFNASSLDVLIIAYFQVASYSDELKSRQELMLSILELANAIGVRFAFPSSSVYIEEFPGKENTTLPKNLNRAEVDEKIKSYLKALADKKQIIS